METPQNPEVVKVVDSGFGSEEKINGQKLTICNHEKSDGYVTIDLDNFSTGINKDFSSSPRFKRSLSRKGNQKGNEKISSFDANAHYREGSPGNSPSKGSNTVEKVATVGGGAPVEAADPTVSNSPRQLNHQHHHQITITTPTEKRVTPRKNSFKRSYHSWILDPKKVLFFSATLSSIGTISLILLTLSMNRADAQILA